MFAEDLSKFFDTTGFAVRARYNSVADVDGIFEAAYLEPLGEEVQGTQPVFWCDAANVPSAAHGDVFVIPPFPGMPAGGTFKVCGVEPDGTGVVMLRLELQ